MVRFIDTLNTLAEETHRVLNACRCEEDLNKLRLSLLGKKGKLTLQLKELSKLPADERAHRGRLLNETVQSVRTALDEKQHWFRENALAERLRSEAIDTSLPAEENTCGGWHPISRVRCRIEAIFARAGYETIVGPEIESDYYNFEALNFPPMHPARTLHDTFYFADKQLLRTHTSPGQIRAMETRKPPFRIICPGKTYRCDYDATHSPMFHQVEGMVIDKGISFADLKGTLQMFVNVFFGHKVRLRFRASYFPFTEPSAEVDILRESVALGTDNKKTEVSAKERWLEILGCGMVHPNVLKAGGLDPNIYSGFAFGLGVERMAMLSLGINDIRLFYENDMRFLNFFV